MDGQKAFGEVLLGLIALYFALQGRDGPPAPPSSSPQGEASPTCQARVWAATLGYQEARLQLEGQASLIRLAWPQGGLEVETPKVCSAGECRVPIPRSEARGGEGGRVPPYPPGGVRAWGQSLPSREGTLTTVRPSFLAAR